MSGKGRGEEGDAAGLPFPICWLKPRSPMSLSALLMEGRLGTACASEGIVNSSGVLPGLQRCMSMECRAESWASAYTGAHSGSASSAEGQSAAQIQWAMLDA